MKEAVDRMRERTKSFALRVVAMYQALPDGRAVQTIGYQVFRAGTSVGAQYREACRSRSDAEIVSKLQSVLQELDETSYWLELLVESEIVTQKRLAPLMKEADELTRMIVTAVRNIKKQR